MYYKKILVAFVVLVSMIIGLNGCKPISPESKESKESKLKKKRDELVEWKEEREKRSDPIQLRIIESVHSGCLRENSLREESKDCDKEKQESLEKHRNFVKIADDRLEKIRLEIKELEQSPDTNQNR